MFGWLRRRPPARDIPDALWVAVLQRYRFLVLRPADERERLRQMAGELLAAKEFHGAKGFVVTDEVALSIAVQAVLPVLNLGLSWYDDFVGIVVHADEVVARRTEMDESGVVHQWDEVIAGEAMDGGPVMLSWRDAAGMNAGTHEAYNVVIHEFIHKIDMRDGRADGCPPLPPAARRAWLELMEREYEAFREQAIIAERFGGAQTWLDPYGAESIDEFFAVACEAYFVAPERFAAEHAALASLFDGFFGARRRA
ncbi:zinc-dependent peptidase [Ramlibacter solisilvae]|uniref:Membrane protein n=1 Tax=Ramlibacter tataouinensis TaxID=94132 RepID=A0A127JPD4_9BURK|nr:M90 family metallopeptidase [Ramlibacter tataouinensis]AMO21837.1 membrane protein [Ramlibacter tataouinensis]